MEFEEWWAKQTANFDPEEIGLMQLARVTWHAAQDIEREACAKVCLQVLEESNNIAASVCAGRIRTRSNAIKITGG